MNIQIVIGIAVVALLIVLVVLFSRPDVPPVEWSLSGNTSQLFEGMASNCAPEPNCSDAYASGSDYTNDAFDVNQKIKPNFIVKLVHNGKCSKHKMSVLFKYVEKQMLADQSAATAGIEFVTEVKPNDEDGHPKVFKIRPNGQVLEYTGFMDFGPFHDWVLNEGLLF